MCAGDECNVMIQQHVTRCHNPVKWTLTLITPSSLSHLLFYSWGVVYCVEEPLSQARVPNHDKKEEKQPPVSIWTICLPGNELGAVCAHMNRSAALSGGAPDIKPTGERHTMKTN